MGRGSERAASDGAAAMDFFHAEDHVFGDPVPRLNDNRTQGREMRVSSAAVIHGYAVESRGTESFDVGSELLQMPTKRLLPLVQTAHHLEPRVLNPLRATSGMNAEGVECLNGEAALVRAVEQPPPFQVRKRFDLLEERCPLLTIQAEQFFGQPAEQLCQSEDEEGSLRGAGAAGQRCSVTQYAAQLIQGYVKSRDPGDMCSRQPIQQQADRQEFQQAAGGRRVGHAVAADFNLLDHSAPAAKGQERGGKELFPFPFWHAQRRQRFEHGTQRADARFHQTI